MPDVPTTFSQVLVHHQSIFPSDSHPFLLEDAPQQIGATDELSERTEVTVVSKTSLRTGVPELIVALDAAPELYTVLYTIVVCGVAFFFRGFRPSTSAIMSLTAFAREVVVSQK